MNDTTTTAKVMHYGRRSCQVAGSGGLHGRKDISTGKPGAILQSKILKAGGYVITRNDFKIHQVPKTLQKPHTA